MSKLNDAAQSMSVAVGQMTEDLAKLLETMAGDDDVVKADLNVALNSGRDFRVRLNNLVTSTNDTPEEK